MLYRDSKEQYNADCLANYYDESNIMKLIQYISSFVKLVRPQPTRHTVKSSHGPLVVISSHVTSWWCDELTGSLTRCMVMRSELLPKHQSPHSRWKCVFTKTTLWLCTRKKAIYFQFYAQKLRRQNVNKLNNC